MQFSDLPLHLESENEDNVDDMEREDMISDELITQYHTPTSKIIVTFI